MKKGSNKKAQEGMSAGAVGAIVLVLIVVVLLILVLTGVMNPILENLGLLSDRGVASVVTACETYVQISGSAISATADYCSFKEVKVDGRTQWINCEDSRVQNLMKPESKNVLTCPEIINMKKAQCITLFRKAKANSLVNGDECTTLGITCENLGKEPSNGECPPENQPSYTRLIRNYGEGNNACCVVPLS